VKVGQGSKRTLTKLYDEYGWFPDLSDRDLLAPILSREPVGSKFSGGGGEFARESEVDVTQNPGDCQLRRRTHGVTLVLGSSDNLSESVRVALGDCHPGGNRRRFSLSHGERTGSDFHP
jgi:hypothetical protein